MQENPTEEWRLIEGSYGRASNSRSYYEVSSFGRVRRVTLLKSYPARAYRAITLFCPDGVRRPRNIHLLVAPAFLGPRPPGFVINHIDGQPATNNRADNLEYVSQADNIAHAYRIGLIPRIKPRARRGDNHHSTKLSQEDRAEIRASSESIHQLARRFGVTRSTIRRWQNQRGMFRR